ncbi:MAG: hypothetical protein ABI590_00560 [Ilumatobacteraceae bacterium]
MSTFWIRIDRDVISVSGPDARSFLHSQLSQDVSTMSGGDALASFVLQPTGKVEALVRVACVENELFTLDTEHGWGDAVMVRLQRFKIRVKVDLRVEVRSILAYRNCAGERIENGLPAWRNDGTAFDVLEIGSKPIVGIRQGSLAEFDELRIRTGWPLMGQDLTTDMIPGETGIIECAVSFTKGCYPGQELVERMDSRGSTAPRMLRVIHATANTSAGDDVILDGAIVGKYTSVADLIALAVVKRGVDFARL